MNLANSQGRRARETFIERDSERTDRAPGVIQEGTSEPVVRCLGVL